MTTVLHYKARPSLVPKKQSLTDMAYSAIKAEINAGKIPLDSFINIPEIEHQLEMSRTPIREAMLRLQTEKVVEIVPKRGIRVLALSAGDLANYYQIVAGLELQALGNICARKLTRTDIMPLLYALSAEEAALRAENFEAWADADEKFHRSLFILNGNPRLQEAGINFRDIIQRANMEALRHIAADDRMRCLRDHNEVKELLLRADENYARERYLEHNKWLGTVIANTLAEKEITRL
ncbi:GntR family transcriptional regulator [Sneathiella litorea]|uniref:FCD domain-containing protein n=1 Tax=Sneathiella litorea TaxID=2606216 RepID=A0A6L8W7N6_9PROT|nr:GntR family transcriptional regulator [Sneathiella litorea]MZR30257.1 FCD domain-containing protein [Sneathiella litorea]